MPVRGEVTLEPKRDRSVFVSDATLPARSTTLTWLVQPGSIPCRPA